MDMVNKVLNADWVDILPNIESNSIDCVVTDPPFGMSYVSNHRETKYAPIHGDDNLDWMPARVENIHRVCKHDAHLYVFCSHHNVHIFKQELGKLFSVKNILIWEKNNTGMGDLSGDYAPKYEMILFCSNGNRKLNGRRDPNILHARRTQNDLHPTEKPIELIRYLIEKSTHKGDIVLDTFAGSFTTAVAAYQTGHNFICMDINQEYCNTGQARMRSPQIGLFS